MPKNSDTLHGVDDDLPDDLPEAEDLEAALDAAEEEDFSHPILSPDEVKAARQKARDRVAALSKKNAMDALVAQEMMKLQGASGLHTGDPVRDELVTVSLDLAEHSDGITLNNDKFFHGHTYTVPRHVADTLRDIQQRGQHHQSELDGKPIADRFRRPQMVVISGRTGAVSSAQRVG
jgi:hypothetical protein